MLENLKQDVLAANLELPRLGLVDFTWGNVSGRDPATGAIVIKPSGVPYETMEAEENIFSNAFMAHATHIDVHQEMKEMFMVSTYADNGDGMTQDQIDRFMMATFGDGISCGIGSRNIMRCAVNHKSPLTISSEPGKGTTIRIVTPYTV